MAILISVMGIAPLFCSSPVLASTVNPEDVIRLTNTARSTFGLLPVTESAALTTAAQAKAADMIRTDYFAHVSPAGVEPWFFIKQAGYQYRAAGENLAINYTDSTEQHEAWMASETHRANILNIRYQDMGVAVIEGRINGKAATLTVAFFGDPLPVGVAHSVAAAPPVVQGALQEGSTTVSSVLLLGLIVLMSALILLPSILLVRAMLWYRAEKQFASTAMNTIDMVLVERPIKSFLRGP